MPDKQEQISKTKSLEETDHKESIRQLWWTLGVTVVALVFIAYYTL